jgi:hypothetical protein
MNSRAEIAILALAPTLSPQPGPAQPVKRRARIGVMTTAGKSEGMLGPEPANFSVKALLHGLSELGCVLDRDFEIMPRCGESEPGRSAALAGELARLSPDLIIAPGPMLPGLEQATATIPIVMAGAFDPVGEGYIQSLSRPGGNFTGLSSQSTELSAKRLSLLKEAVPGPGPVAVLWDEQSRSIWQATAASARAGGWPLVGLELRKADDPGPLLAAAVAAGAEALLVLGGSISLRPGPEGRGAGQRQPAADDARATAYGRGRRPDVLCRQSQRHLAGHGALCRSDPEGRQARRHSCRAADDLRAGAQSEDRQGARPRAAADDSPSRRRVDRMKMTAATGADPAPRPSRGQCGAIRAASDLIAPA